MKHCGKGEVCKDGKPKALTKTMKRKDFIKGTGLVSAASF